MRAFIITIVITFAAIAGICYMLDTRYFAMQGNPVYSFKLLMIGNTILALLSLANYFIISNALKDKNPNAVVRAKTAGTMLKFFVAVGALMAYIFVNNRMVHKPSIFIFMGMYIAYAAIEAITLSRMAKNKNA